jgi:hypothetical protein
VTKVFFDPGEASVNGGEIVSETSPKIREALRGIVCEILTSTISVKNITHRKYNRVYQPPKSQEKCCTCAKCTFAAQSRALGKVFSMKILNKKIRIKIHRFLAQSE